jgi:lipopolysaccharide transport system ATP-binding protein
MKKATIKVENISKKYMVGKPPTNSIQDVWKNLWLPHTKAEEFWALKNISFELNPGEVLGVLGNNGAGKSTLLKILARITAPTLGKVLINGKLNSLLELGTGFHPDFTGRENIFLNGSLLGMKTNEIKQKFDEIVAFSGLDSFIDTPVKQYSSGMYIRLAFAVAAHLDADILLIDEVLAVGDLIFQQKSLEKMENISHSGKTIIFVSHQLSTIAKICTQGIVLRQGEIAYTGTIQPCIEYYLSQNLPIDNQSYWKNSTPIHANTQLYICEAKIHNQFHVSQNTFFINEPIGITFIYEVLYDNLTFTHGFNLYNQQQIHILSSHDTNSPHIKQARKKGVYISTVWIPANLLAEGIFRIGIALFEINPFLIHCIEDFVLTFRVIDVIDGSTARGYYTGDFPGLVRPLLNWETRELNL